MKNSEYYRKHPDSELKKNLSESVLEYGKHYPYILFNPDYKEIELITSHQRFIWELFEKPQTAKDIIMKYFEEYEIIETEEIISLIDRWAKTGLLESQGKKIRKSRYSEFNLTISIKNFDKLVGVLYRNVFWIFYKPISVLIILGICAVGSASFVWQLMSNDHQYPEGDLIGILTLIVIASFSMILHELSHAFTAKHFNTSIHSGGFKFFVGIPMLFVDTSEILTKRKIERILVTLSGVFSNIIIFSFASILQLFQNEPSIIIYHLQVINLTATLLNLAPFLGLDGYYLMIDMIKVQNIKKYSGDFIMFRWNTFIGISFEKKLFIFFYSVLNVGFLFLIIYISVNLWFNYFSFFIANLIDLLISLFAS